MGVHGWSLGHANLVEGIPTPPPSTQHVSLNILKKMVCSPNPALTPSPPKRRPTPQHPHCLQEPGGGAGSNLGIRTGFAVQLHNLLVRF